MSAAMKSEIGYSGKTANSLLDSLFRRCSDTTVYERYTQNHQKDLLDQVDRPMWWRVHQADC